MFGQTVTFAAFVTPNVGGGTPTGTVAFHIPGQADQTRPLDGSGTATVTTSTLLLGANSISADYNGDPSFSPSSGNLTPDQTVNPANTTTTLAGPTAAQFGQTITFTATVTPNAPGGGVPTGNVFFNVDGNAPAPVPLVGNQASFTTSTLSLGSHNITATYPGNGNYNGSTSSTKSISITPADTVAPTITNLTAPTVTLHNNPLPDYTFTVTFADNAGGSGIDFATLDNNDFVVSGPHNFSENAVLISRTGNVATYGFPGGFVATENGNYTIALNQGAVKDIAGNAVTGGVYGFFNVAITNPAPPANLLVSGPPNGTGFLFSAANGNYAGGSPAYAGLGTVTHPALGDVNGDGIPDMAIGYIAGNGASAVRVISTKDNSVLADFTPFSSYPYGVFVAVGDLNGDGKADIVVTPDAPSAFTGPIFNSLPVILFSGADFSPLAFFDGLASSNGAHGTGANVELGGRAAVSDMNGDGLPDLIVSAGNGGGPRITVWSGQAFQPGRLAPVGQQPSVNPIANLFVFEPSQRGGAFLAVGDVNGDGISDLVVGGGPGGGPRVRIVDSKLLFNPAVVPSLEGVNLDAPANLQNGLVMANFFTGDPNSRGGVRVAVRDVDGDNFMDVVAASGSGQLSSFSVYKGSTLKSGDATAAQTLNPFGAVLDDGVWVG